MGLDPRYRLRTDAAGTWAERVDRRLVCDFCLGPQTTWLYPTKPGAPIVGHPSMSVSGDDAYLACDECHRLLEQHSIGALVERMCHEQRKNQPPGAYPGGVEVSYLPLPLQRRTCRENVLHFMDARTGPARRYEGG